MAFGCVPFITYMVTQLTTRCRLLLQDVRHICARQSSIITTNDHERRSVQRRHSTLEASLQEPSEIILGRDSADRTQHSGDLLNFTHANGSRIGSRVVSGVYVFVLLFACLPVIFLTISQKPIQL